MLNGPLLPEKKQQVKRTLEDLDDGTAHTVTLYNGDKRRGTISFETQLAANVTPADDLALTIADAEEGAGACSGSGRLHYGRRCVDEVHHDSGAKPHDKPVVLGQLTCGAAVASVTLKAIIFRGDDAATPYAQFFNTLAGCNLTAAYG